MERRPTSGQIATALDPGSREGTGSDSQERYLPSVLDWFFDWVDGLPVPHWLFYFGLLVALILIVNGASWLDGSTPFGTFDVYRTSLPVYPVFTLGLMHHLNHVARHALAAFRPALGASDADYERLEYELTVLPWRGTWAVLLGSLLFTAVFGAYTPSLVDALRGSPWLAAADLAVYVLVFAVIAVFIYHTLRQLRTVSRIHAGATNLNLFQLTPLYAFSGLTARTGIGLLVLNTFSILTDPATFVNPALFGLTIFAWLGAVACFVVPLHGMHQRIVAEQRLLLAEVNVRLEATIQQLYLRADAKRFSGADALNQLLSGLVTTRDLVARIPTWPWDLRTLTGFLSASLLPIGAGVLSWLADRLLVNQ